LPAEGGDKDYTHVLAGGSGRRREVNGKRAAGRVSQMGERYLFRL